jgi:aspartyl-tRNA(Asn)/glutamyl-tRNA(Gln) amidotransferase subunit B
MASARKARYIANYGLPPYDAGVLTQSKSLADYFEACLRLYNHPKVVSNWVMGEFTALINTAGLEPLEASFTPEHMAELLMMVEEEVISGKMAKEVMVKSFATEKAPRALVVEEGLLQISDQSELDDLADRVIEDNPDSVANYRKGKTNALSFLIGQVMRASKGKANPQIISQLLAEKLR